MQRAQRVQRIRQRELTNEKAKENQGKNQYRAKACIYAVKPLSERLEVKYENFIIYGVQIQV